MKKFTKLMSLFLAALMLLATLTGCAGNNDKKKTSSNVPEVKFPLEETYTIKLMVTGTKDQAKLEKCDFYQKLLKETNVKLELVSLGDEPTTTLNAMLSAGTYGDAIIGVLTDSLLTDMAYGGFLTPIEDYVLSPELMPNYNERGLENNPNAVGTMTLPDGHIYSVARLDLNPAAYLESPLVVNTAWVKQSGADISTIEGFTEYLRYVRDNDMNGDGNPNDEVPFLLATSSGSPYATVQACLQMWGLATKDSALDSYCVVKKGKVSLAPMMDAYKEAINQIAAWYKEGLIWSELYTANKESFDNRLNNREICQFGATFGVIHLSAATSYAADIQPVMLPSVKGYSPCAYLNPGYNGYKNTITVTNNCEHPEIVLAYFDKFFSAEGSLNVLNGPTEDVAPEGYTAKYSLDKDGKVVWGDALTPEQNDANDKISPTMSSCASGSYIFLRTMQDYEDGYIKLDATYDKKLSSYEEYKDVINPEIWPRPYYTQEVNDEIGVIRTDVYNIITQYEAKWVTGQSDINKDWDSYKKQMENAGASSLVDLLQSAYDTWATANNKK